MREETKIQVDIDQDRIREIVQEALRMIHEYLGGEFRLTKEDVLAQLEAVLNSERITVQFFLTIGSTKIPDLVLRVDPRRKEVLCKSKFRKKVAKINHFLRVL